MLNPIEKFKRSILHLNRSLHHCVLLIFVSYLRMIIFLRCTRQSRAPSIDCYVPDNLSHAENQGQRLNALARRAHTNKQTDGRTLPSALSPCFAKATQSIKIVEIIQIP